MYVSGHGSHKPFILWHAVKRKDDYAYTTACDLYMMIVKTVENITDIPSEDYIDGLCTTAACNMRPKLSQELYR